MNSIELIQICGRKRASPNDMVWLEASINYSIIHFRNGKKLVVAKTLKQLQDKLFDYNFFRIHRSYLINMNCIKQFNEHENNIQLIGNQYINVSRRKMPSFKIQLDKRFYVSEY